MHLSEPIFALDLGTTKFCIAALRPGPIGQPPTIETVSVAAKGMRRGMVADLEKASEAINSLLEIAEGQLNLDIRRVVVGIAGSHLASKRVLCSLALEDNVVHAASIRALAAKAEAMHQLPDREILHTVPLSFRVDGREAVDNPVGFTGRMLHGEYFLINADQLYLRDIVRLCNQCGLEVARLYSEPFASASVTVDDVKKEVGVAIADIGGGTTDGIVFQNSKPHAAFSINVAGVMMTSDLAIGLNLSPEEAERVKVFFGVTMNATGSLEVKNLRGETRTITSKQVFPILASRIQELGVLMVKELSGYKGLLGAGILLTGGGSEVRDIDVFMHRLFRISVTKAWPSLPVTINQPTTQSNTTTNLVYASKFATALGLLNLEIHRLREHGDEKKSFRPARYINHLLNWFKELS